MQRLRRVRRQQGIMMEPTFGQRLENPVQWFNWINNQWTMWTLLRALCESRLLDHLGDEPVSFDDLAHATGIGADKLERMASYFAAEDLLTMNGDGKVAHTPHSKYLHANMDVIAVFIHALDAGTPMTEALRQGKTPYEVRFGRPVFEHLADAPETAKKFAALMSFMTSLGNGFVFSQHEFEPFELAVDIGGSHGELLLELLSLHPDARGVLFDLPGVAAMVTDAVRNAKHGDRIEIVGGSFFESVPAADLYLLKMILHDWSDEECVKILGSIRKAIRPGGRLAVIEHVRPETPHPHPTYAMDIAMLVWDTGRERKRSEFESLFESAGFRLDRLTENPAGPSVVEAIPV
jgi:hypothetical protein